MSTNNNDIQALKEKIIQLLEETANNPTEEGMKKLLKKTFQLTEKTALDKGKIDNYRKTLKEILNEQYIRLAYLSKALNKDTKERSLTALMEKLKSKGYSISRDLSKYTDSNPFKNLIYRLLELARLARRDALYAMLLRIYVIAGEKFPKELGEAFLPRYSDREFTLLLSAYLTGVQQGLLEQSTTKS